MAVEPHRPGAQTSAAVATAIAEGDLTRKITVEAQGRDPADQGRRQQDGGPAQRRSPAEVTRVAREVGTEGVLGGQANVPGVRGTWKDLTDNVNCMARNLDQSGAKHRRRDDRRAPTATSSQKITVEVQRRGARRSRTRSTRWWTSCAVFAAEVTRVAREVGTEGRLGGQASVPGVGGTWKDLTDNVNAMAGNLTRAGAETSPT